MDLKNMPRYEARKLAIRNEMRATALQGCLDKINEGVSIDPEVKRIFGLVYSENIEMHRRKADVYRGVLGYDSD